MNPSLESGKELDIIIRAPQFILAIECKDYQKVSRINKKMVDDFLEKIRELKNKNPGQKIIPMFMSKNGLRQEIKDYLINQGIKIDFE